MDFAFDERTEDLRKQLLAFMDEHVRPAERVFEEQVAEMEAAGRGWERPAVIDDLKVQARCRGLWNLFLTHRPEGAGLTNLQYAPLAEITGHSPAIAPEALNCAAPDTGNMELLADFGNEEQQAQWLRPLLDGEIRSAFCMTEPDVASSDANNISTSITRDGDTYVINGRKWWSSGAMDPRCRILIVMGKTDPSAPRHRQQSMILVPRDTPGVNDQARHAGVRLHRRDARGPRRDRVLRCSRSRDQPDRRARATASRSRRPASAPAGSTTACGRSAPPSVPWS